MPDPKPIFPVWLSKEECAQIIAIYEKQGLLGSVVDSIRAAESTQQIK